ncbi:MAG: family four-helix-bundle protein [Mucilaginibacter sp.]|jgi:uncharacterized protein (TIGR02284 family)|nr:family four-helix-bundle protein [Mucilaginibacter sp.]MDB5139566.1 family four-helix-bundle protein [Mucilaginibacter sp.]
MENYKETIETLNDLVEINNDRIRGYEKAIKDTGDENPELKQLFVNHIAESQKFKIELGTEVEVLGKDIENHTTTSGKLHRTWMQLKEAFTGHSTKSILEECEFGEDAIIKAYETAIEDDHTPAYIREILSEHLGFLQEAHDEVKSLRDSVE